MLIAGGWPSLVTRRSNVRNGVESRHAASMLNG
jgi:hypothetical protein